MDYKIHIKDRKNLSESVKNMADECLVCTLPVRPRQEGLQCESCDGWQHRVCNTNISRHDYREAVHRGELIEWTCNNCQQIYTEDTILDTVLDDQQNNTEQPNFTVVKPLLNSPSPAAESTRVDARRSFSIPEKHNESSLIDQPPSSTPETSMEAMSSGFEIISSVSKRAQDKLFDDMGYSYPKKRKNKRTTLWRCSVRSHASGVCPATVTQCGDIFTRGPRDHTHSSKSGTATAARIAQTIKDEAKENIYRPASHIVEEFSMVVYFTSQPFPDLSRHDSEKYFLCPEKCEKEKFPSIHDPPSIDLSVIVPAYNEEERMPIMMDESLEYLEKKQKSNRSFSYEIIIVDDGSTDKTTEVGLKYSKEYGSSKVRVLTLEKNRGKGGAIRLGMMVGRGKKLLFADADGASKFCDLAKLEESLKKVNTRDDNLVLVCGSRAHLEKESIATRSLLRTILMKGFHFGVWFLCVKTVKDTQCGFKLFTREAAVLLFSNLHVERWAFDVDLLFLAEYLNMTIAEVAVEWQEIDGSKLTPFWSWLQMGMDVFLVRMKYMIGAWKIKSPIKTD